MDPLRLAEAGFAYTGYADCVRCFQCGLGLRSWKVGDDVYTEHERFRPTCPFLQSQLTRRNTPSAQTVSGNTNQENTSRYGATTSANIQPENPQTTRTDSSQPVCGNFISLQSRVDSFDNWDYSQVVDTHRLAKEGFFYTGRGDCLRCFQCGSKWRFEIGDDGYSNHETINPNCPCLQSQQSSRNGPTVSGNTQENSSHYGATTSANTQPENPQTARTDSSQPVCGSFNSPQSRVASFHSWGYSQVVDTHRLAAAGIYYTGHGDYLRCFQCGSIWRYKIGDDGYSNHERMNSNCSCLQSQQSSRNGSTVSGNTQGDFSQREQRRQSFTNWQGLHPLDPEELCEFYYLTGPGYRMKCFMCHCSVYIHGNENLEHSAQDLNEGRPIGCLCAERLSRLSFTLCAIIDEEQGTA